MKRLTAILACSLALLACDKEDQFDQVEPVTAPKATEPAKPVDTTQKELPEGHPPMGSVGNQKAPPLPQGEAVRFASPDQYGKTGPLRWNAPTDWQAARPATSMRLAEYIIPATGAEPAVLSVFHFGAQGGGGVDANINRWTGQFSGGEPAQRDEKTVNGMKVHTVDASGSFDPGMAGGNAPAKDEYRMLGAIVESDAGLYFFKLVGPKPVVGDQEKAWNEFVDSFAKG